MLFIWWHRKIIIRFRQTNAKVWLSVAIRLTPLYNNDARATNHVFLHMSIALYGELEHENTYKEFRILPRFANSQLVASEHGRVVWMFHIKKTASVRIQHKNKAHKQSLLTKASGITAIIIECKHRSNENLAAASEPKKEKYKGSDNTPVVTKIKLLAARKERQPNAILDFALISAVLGTKKIWIGWSEIVGSWIQLNPCLF